MAPFAEVLARHPPLASMLRPALTIRRHVELRNRTLSKPAPDVPRIYGSRSDRGQYVAQQKPLAQRLLSAEIVAPLGHIRSDVRVDLGTASQPERASDGRRRRDLP